MNIGGEQGSVQCMPWKFGRIEGCAAQDEVDPSRIPAERCSKSKGGARIAEKAGDVGWAERGRAVSSFNIVSTGIDWP